MSILSRFSEKERDYHRYQSRREALRVQRTIQRVLDRHAQPRKPRARTEQAARAAAEAERQATEAERQAKEAERQAKEAERQARKPHAPGAGRAQGEQAALAEVARLKALLQQQTDR